MSAQNVGDALEITLAANVIIQVFVIGIDTQCLGSAAVL